MRWVRKVMRLVLYFFFFIEHLPINQHYPLQSSSLGKPHTARDVAPAPGSSTGSLHVEVQSAGLSRPFGCCPQFQNDDFWDGIWVLGKGRSHTDSDQASMVAAEPLKYLFWPKIHSQRWQCDKEHCRDSRLYCLLTVCPWGMNYLRTTPWLSKKQVSMVLIFDLLILAFFGRGEMLVWHSELCHFVSGSYSKNHVSSPVMTCLKKILSFSMHSRRSRHTFLRFSFCSLVRIFGTSLAQIFCMPSSKAKFRGQFGDSNSTHYWSFWLSNADQTSRDPSLWSHFRPFLTCKVFWNEVHLPYSHGHPKMLYAT